MQCLLDDPSAILAFYKEESSFHNILLGYFRQPNKNLFIIPITLKWMKQSFPVRQICSPTRRSGCDY